MRFGLIHEATVPHGTTHHRRYKEMIDEVVWAEQMGFDFWGASEQHFLRDFGMGATEVFYGAVAMETSRIKLRHMVRLLLSFNHPLRLVEQLATLDLLSDGRAEFGTGRSNSIITLDAMGVDPTQTRAQWDEALTFIVKAMTEDPVIFHGKFWNMKDPVYVTPRVLQDPHPPLYVATTSLEMHTIAGRKGIGAMCWDSYFGWDYTRECARLYRKEIPAPSNQVGKFVTDSLSFLVLPAYCAETKKEAMEQGGPTAIEFFNVVLEVYLNLARRSPDYKYMEQIQVISDHRNDVDYVQNMSPGVMVGTPDYFIDQIRRLEAAGYDEVILRLDGVMKHDQLMRSIELIGKYVIPAFKSPNNLVTGGLLAAPALA